jgi:hypothetical protein
MRGWGSTAQEVATLDRDTSKSAHSGTEDCNFSVWLSRSGCNLEMEAIGSWRGGLASGGRPRPFRFAQRRCACAEAATPPALTTQNTPVCNAERVSEHSLPQRTVGHLGHLSVLNGTKNHTAPSLERSSTAQSRELPQEVCTALDVQSTYRTYHNKNERLEVKFNLAALIYRVLLINCNG